MEEREGTSLNRVPFMCQAVFTHYLDGSKGESPVVLFSFVTPQRYFYVYFMHLHGWQDYFHSFNTI